MKLYHLNYVYGSYEDREDICLGIFSSPEKRDEAETKIRETANLKKSGWLYGAVFHQEGRFCKWKSNLDEGEY